MASLNEAFGGGGRSVKFESDGEVFTGTVTEEPKQEQQNDYNTGKPAFWDDGKPKMQLVFTLKVDPEDGDDDGIRRLYVDKKRLKAAILDALKAAGVKDTAELIGGKLSVKFLGRDMEWVNPKNGRKPQPGQEPKLWAAKFERGAKPVADLFDAAPKAAATDAPF